MPSESDLLDAPGALEGFGAAIFRQYVVVKGFVAGEDGVHGFHPGDILDLAAAEIEFRGEPCGDIVREAGDQGFPDLGSYGGFRSLEVDFVEETPLEGLVDVVGKVGSGDKDAFHRLHLLEDNVLDGVLHLVHGALGTLPAYSENRVSLVEQHYRLDFLFGAHLLVGREGCLDVLLALSHPHTLDLVHIDREYVPSGGARQLIDSLCLAGAGTAVEQAGESFPHPVLFKVCGDIPEMLWLEKIGEPFHLGVHVRVEEQFFSPSPSCGK